MIRCFLKQHLLSQARNVQSSMFNPLEAQAETFSRLKALLQGSEISHQSGLENCLSLEDCRRLKIATSDTLKPFFKRSFDHGVSESRTWGKSDILGFARTSGTVGEPKDIPMNGEYFKSLDRSLLRMVACHLYSTGAWETLMRGKRVLLGSRPLFGGSPTGLPISDFSGLIPTRTWSLLRRLYLPRYPDLWIQDWNEKVERILEQAYGQDVHTIVGIPALAMDFARRAKTKFNVTHLNQIWPKLAHYIYGGIHLSSEQKKELRQSWTGSGGKLSFIEAYFATEGTIAFCFDPKEAGLTLNLLENLYLFRPDGEALSDSNVPTFLLPHEVRVGHVYSIHVTTPGGLVNYHLGDRIEVISARPLLIRIVGREKDEISMTGEKITIEQISLTLDRVGLTAKRLGPYLPVVWVEYAERPHLVWGVPIHGQEKLESRLPSQMDGVLCELNVLYAEALRHEKVIGPSRMVEIPISIFEAYEKSRLGRGQFKPKRLFNSRAAFVEAYQFEPNLSFTDKG
jgi:hypothetical protein